WFALKGHDRVSVPHAYADEILPRCIEALLNAADSSIDIRGVAHRITHGGDDFVQPVTVDAAVLDRLDALVDLAPLHMPANVAGVRAALDALPELPHIAVFDTA